MPASERRLLALIDNDEIDIQELASVIETCPPVAARILGLAQSAFFSQTIPCRSIFDALVRTLGLDLVKNLVMGIVTSSRFSPLKCPGFDVHRYWRQALCAATYGRLLARECVASDSPNANDAYLHGLLHNLGILALAHVAPQDMSRVFLLAENTPDRPLADIESEQLGLNHAQAGSWLASHWHLPTDLVTVIARHLEPHYRGPRWLACQLLRLSITEASLAADAATDDEAMTPLEDDLARGFRHLGIPSDCRQPLARRFQTQIEEINGIANIFVNP